MANIKSFPNNQDVYIGAEDVMKWMHGRTSGVFGANGNAAVSAVQGEMAVSVSDGLGWITDAGGNGIVWWNDNEAVSATKLKVAISAADGALNRIDRIIVEWKTTNYVDLPEIKVLTGSTSSTPNAPALTNNSTIRQISLARVYVAAGTTVITASMITDERLDASVCGIVTEKVQVDTSMANAQFTELLERIERNLLQIYANQVPDGSITREKLAEGAVHTTETAILTASGWEDNRQAVRVNDVSADILLVVAPDPDSYDAYTEASIRCIEQGESELVFECKSVPNVDLNVIVTCFVDGEPAAGGNSGSIGTDYFKYENPNIRAVNHRGYNTAAPENTLSAFRLSKKMGYKYVECDVCFTSDGVPVLLHDSTVDRTSNGTGSIADMTFDEVRALDFGGWFSAEYTGEKIPALAEFIILCKQNGLLPYIEIKGGITAKQAETLVGIVKRYDMRKNATWISFDSNSLEQIKAVDTNARLGFVVDAITESTITTATGLKTDKNDVFVDVFHGNATEEAVELCVDSEIPLEVWTVNTEKEMLNLDRYISGYTSDNILANVALHDADVPEYIHDGNLLGKATWIAGYLSVDNTNGIGRTTSYSNGEITTLLDAYYPSADMVAVTHGKTYVLTYRCPSAKEGWWAMGEVFKDGTKPLRTGLPLTNYTVDGSDKVYVYEYTPASNVSGIHLSGRTHAFEGSVSIDEANAMATRVGGNHFTMHEA